MKTALGRQLEFHWILDLLGGQRQKCGESKKWICLSHIWLKNFSHWWIWWLEQIRCGCGIRLTAVTGANIQDENWTWQPCCSGGGNTIQAPAQRWYRWQLRMNTTYIEYYIFWLLLAPRPLCWRCCAWRRRRVWCLEAPWMGWRSWKLRNHWRSNLLEGTCSEMIQLSKNEYYVSCTGPNAPRNVPENLGCLRVLWADWWNAPAPCV